VTPPSSPSPKQPEPSPIPDVLAPGLRVLFCGINPGRVSAAAAAHFANPRNDFWRLLHAWATALVAGTLVLVAAVYVLQRSLVLTARGPRLAAGARTHLLALAALLLLIRGVGFWLDRFDLLYSPRGLVFGASYTDVHASLPAKTILFWIAASNAVVMPQRLSSPAIHR
jgi:hypothetical protein